MALDLIKSTLKYTIFLGLIGIVIAWLFGLQNSFSHSETINGMKILVFDYKIYVDSLTNSFMTNALQFEDILPNRTWQEVQGAVWDEVFWNSLFNNMALIFDWLYFPLNFLLWIIRWISWVMRVALALIGWDFTTVNGEYNSTLIKVLTWIIEQLMIPYI